MLSPEYTVVNQGTMWITTWLVENVGVQIRCWKRLFFRCPEPGRDHLVLLPKISGHAKFDRGHGELPALLDTA
jgi:hypothetical protein